MGATQTYPNKMSVAGVEPARPKTIVSKTIAAAEITPYRHGYFLLRIVPQLSNFVKGIHKISPR